MKYLTRSLKGNYKYISKQSVFELLKTIVLYLMALGIFFIGYYTLGTKRSLWSVIAVLGLLPASKSMVETIMFFRFKSISADLYENIKDSSGNIPVIYENILTTTQSSFMVSAICYFKGSLCLLYLGDVNNNKKIENHMYDILKKGGYKNISVKVYNSENDYINRINEMNNHFDTSEKSNYQSIFNTIKAVSL